MKEFESFIFLFFYFLFFLLNVWLNAKKDCKSFYFFYFYFYFSFLLRLEGSSNLGGKENGIEKREGKIVKKRVNELERGKMNFKDGEKKLEKGGKRKDNVKKEKKKKRKKKEEKDEKKKIRQ
ncbi:hypothetical protein RFI_05987 [Reticulomyxa filosa]|uniref:Uncharacterized protein n=1 Tax=Reticulomyxa filosa TaxID=46433 RepID=X6NZ63_RETFI|nr:hypothetical protein RFI_05987 [Reticulomyxa filosa]|eukprot:ETO31129.1 hypothetical protein RFI_05987 [Reticulomyxa filosa]